MTVDAKGANGHVHWIVATLRGKFDYDTLLNTMSPLHLVAGSRPASHFSCIIFLLLRLRLYIALPYATSISRVYAKFGPSQSHLMF